MSEPGRDGGTVIPALDPDVLRRMPKVELHCHLEGSLRGSTLLALADHRRVPLPTREPSELYGFDDLAGFAAAYQIACRVLVTASDFALATYESLEDAAMSSNVRYREMFFDPTRHDGVAYPVMLDGIVDGVRAAEHDFGITTRLIPSIHRQDSPSVAMAMLESVIARRNDYVVGIGMDGDEMAAPPERFAAVYQAAAVAGLHRSAHVSHQAPAASIETCLDVLGCERIDHGYHVIDDPALVRRLRDRGTAFLCATSTAPLCGWPAGLTESPVRRMVEAGLTVTLNSDDPAMLGTDLGSEFVKVCNAWRLSAERARQFVTDAIDAAWCDASERAALTSTICPELDRMLGIGAGAAHA